MAVQTRSVLKTYFETGDKPTAAQFGDLIDSALMAKHMTVTSTTIVASANCIYASTTASATTVDVSYLIEGESCVVNKVGSMTICNATVHLMAPIV